jgi:hypothetical protein
VKLDREAAIFGVADGLTSTVGLVLGLAASGHLAAAWAAAFSGGLAAFPGMASGKYQSDPGAGKLAAVLCGLCTTAGSVVPAIPLLAGTGPFQLAACAVLAASVCALVAIMRPEDGARAWALSFGCTAAAAVLTFAFGLLGA